MKKLNVSFVAILLLAVIAGLIYKNQFRSTPVKQPEKHDVLFIQGTMNSPVMAEIKRTLESVVNAIIKEELQLPDTHDFNFFLPKQDQRVTLYSLRDVAPQHDAIIFSAVEQFITKQKNLLLIEHAQLSPRLAFFGDNQDELVLMIDDRNGELSAINNRMQALFNKADATYQQTNRVQLYDRAASEKYPYMPHIGIARIRSTSIKNEIKDPADTQKVYARIQQRILHEATKICTKMLESNDTAVQFASICVFEIPSRVCIKNYPM